MRIIVLGGVAAGTKVAAKLMREDRSNEVIILNKGENISYAGCGLPYYVGHVIEEKEQLIVNTPIKYEKLTGAQVFTNKEAIKVDKEKKKVTAIDCKTGEETVYTYDKLVIATGASPVRPSIEGINLKNVFVMRTPEDAIMLRELADSQEVKRAVVVGAGYIGLELAENLMNLGIKPFVMDMADQVLPGFDQDIAEYIETKLAENKIPVLTNTEVIRIEGDKKVEKVITNKRAFKADMVILCAGIRPNTAFLDSTGLEMVKGTLLTNAKGQTNDENIYAVGDCAMVSNAITNKAVWSPMGSTANINGRLVAQNIAGAKLNYKGTLGTAICKLAEFNVGRTGLTMEDAVKEGFNAVSVITVVDDKAHYMPGASSFIIKMIADRKSLMLLGVQVIGKGAVDKIIDMTVTAMMCHATLNDLEDMDLAYAPPFSTAIHPFTQTVNILKNKINGVFDTFTPQEYASKKAEGYQIIDTCLVPSIEGAPYVDLTSVNGMLSGFEPEDPLLLVCNKGKRAYLLQNRLKYYGYRNTKVLEGGISFTNVTVE